MKKLISFAIYVMAVASMVAVVSCKKENQNHKHNNSGQAVSHFDASHITDMNDYLKNFRTRLQSASKNDECLEYEEARWHLEAVLNYTYGDAGHKTSDIQHDTIYYTIPINDSIITLNQIKEAYNSITQDVSIAYNNCDFSEKSILSIQASFENSHRNGGIRVKCILCTRGYSPPSTWPPRFDTTDYWDEYYFIDDDFGYGKCGPYVGECIGSGAPKELTKKANMRILPISCSDGFRTYVLNPGTAQIIPEGMDYYQFMMDENSPSGYKLYVRHTDDGCIPPYEMNYYLDKSQEIIQFYKPAGKDPICCEYFWDNWLGVKGDKAYGSFHGLLIQYAEIHCEHVGFDQ